MGSDNLIEVIIGRVPSVTVREKSNQPAIQVPVEDLYALMQALRDDAAFAFDLLLTHTAIDWLAEGQFELVYQLFSTTHGYQLMVSTRVSREEPVAPTVSSLWPIAEWQEREVYDLFGVLYDEHPDLRRIFLEDDWVGHPLRKDYSDKYMLERPE